MKRMKKSWAKPETSPSFAEVFLTALGGKDPDRYEPSHRNTPKPARERRTLAPVPALSDAAGRLGHAPRGRKKTRR